MGLTKRSVGKSITDNDIETIKRKGNEKIIALAGNPNVGKSTVFNGLTGMDQHTGNWSGKTVTNAVGYFKGKDEYCLIDIPGTYSLYPVSLEEETACELICFGKSDCTAVVCDASSLERNLALVLQISQVSDKVIVILNLMDEAERKGIKIDADLLETFLGLPVICVTAKKRKTLKAFTEALDKGEDLFAGRKKASADHGKYIEQEISCLSEKLKTVNENKGLPYRWIALKLLENDERTLELIGENYGKEFVSGKMRKTASESRKRISECENGEDIRELIMSRIMKQASDICKKAVRVEKESKGMSLADKLFTGKYTAFPFMILFLMIILWITITGANYISDGLAKILFGFENVLKKILDSLNAPYMVSAPLIDGVYHVLAWVISVMLPPMAIFFPLFSLLEDAGYLPRIAYALDRPFCKCGTCGKQSLTMCMGFGCNAAGVVGCRIIDSPRERILAMVTNSFMICNGRFPILITLTSVFFCGLDNSRSAFSSFVSASVLTLFILLGIVVTFIVTKALSVTLLKGTPSSFTLELPSYRMPDIGSVIVRSVFDRTIFVLGRAVAAAAPAGLIIWLAANVYSGDMSLLEICSRFCDPVGRIMGMDGVVLMAFILGFSANETVIPIAVMAYTSGGILTEAGNMLVLSDIFLSKGWTWITAVCVMIFTVLHWPCSTTLITVYKETKSIKWTVLSFVIPTLCGVLFCTFFNLLLTGISVLIYK